MSPRKVFLSDCAASGRLRQGDRNIPKRCFCHGVLRCEFFLSCSDFVPTTAQQPRQSTNSEVDEACPQSRFTNTTIATRCPKNENFRIVLSLSLSRYHLPTCRTNRDTWGYHATFLCWATWPSTSPLRTSSGPKPPLFDGLVRRRAPLQKRVANGCENMRKPKVQKVLDQIFSSYEFSP